MNDTRGLSGGFCLQNWRTKLLIPAQGNINDSQQPTYILGSAPRGIC